MFQGWSKETRNKVLWNTFVGNFDAQRKLLDLLLVSDNPEVWEAGRDFLIANYSPEFVKKLLGAFAVESVPGRRAMLAYILGGNAGNSETHPVLFEMLTGGDVQLLQAVLPRLNMGAFDPPGEYGDRIRAQLRELATSSSVPAIRTRAVWSLRGESTADGARFLLSVALDANAASEVRRAAIGSLPTTYDSHPPLVDEQLAGLWTIVRDESCDLKVRRSAADVLTNSTGKGMYRPTESDQALLKRLLDAK